MSHEFRKACNRVTAEYYDRLRGLLDKLRESARAYGIQTSDVLDLSVDGLNLTLVVHPITVPPQQADYSRHDRDFLAEITMPDSLEHEGDVSGINFELKCKGKNGRIYGVCAPGNHTAEVWVDPNDAEAVESRFDDFEYGVEEVFIEALIDCFNEIGIPFPDIGSEQPPASHAHNQRPLFA